MNFSKMQGVFRFSGFSSLLRPILPAAFDIAGNFTRKMYFWIFFWRFWGLLHHQKYRICLQIFSQFKRYVLRIWNYWRGITPIDYGDYLPKIIVFRLYRHFCLILTKFVFIRICWGRKGVSFVFKVQNISLEVGIGNSSD